MISTFLFAIYLNGSKNEKCQGMKLFSVKFIWKQVTAICIKPQSVGVYFLAIIYYLRVNFLFITKLF